MSDFQCARMGCMQAPKFLEELISLEVNSNNQRHGQVYFCEEFGFFKWLFSLLIGQRTDFYLDLFIEYSDQGDQGPE